MCVCVCVCFPENGRRDYHINAVPRRAVITLHVWRTRENLSSEDRQRWDAGRDTAGPPARDSGLWGKFKRQRGTSLICTWTYEEILCFILMRGREEVMLDTTAVKRSYGSIRLTVIGQILVAPMFVFSVRIQCCATVRVRCFAKVILTFRLCIVLTFMFDVPLTFTFCVVLTFRFCLVLTFTFCLVLTFTFDNVLAFAINVAPTFTFSVNTFTFCVVHIFFTFSVALTFIFYADIHRLHIVLTFMFCVVVLTQKLIKQVENVFPRCSRIFTSVFTKMSGTVINTQAIDAVRHQRQHPLKHTQTHIHMMLSSHIYTHAFSKYCLKREHQTVTQWSPNLSSPPVWRGSVGSSGNAVESVSSHVPAQRRAVWSTRSDHWASEELLQWAEPQTRGSYRSNSQALCQNNIKDIRCEIRH